MDPRRIVLVMLEPPLPFGNAAARWYYVLLRGLVDRGHRVTALATCSKAEDLERSRDLFPAPQYDLRVYPLPADRGLAGKLETLRRPYSFSFGPDLRRDLEAELARGYDILHLEQLWCGWLADGHVDRALVNVHHLQMIDLEEIRPSSLRQAVEHRLIFRGERQVIRRLKHFRSCTPRLVEPIRAINPGAVVTTVPVGIDSSLYPYIPDERRTASKTLSLIGSMMWYPTQSAAIRLLTRLWPEIKRRVPEAQLQIVGWGARRFLADHLSTPGLEVHEDVPDTRPFFERTSVMLYAPARGSGMKIKVLEAMGFGVPVVTTGEGVEGLPAEDGLHAGVCEDDAGLIERAVALLTDRARQDAQRRAARALLESHCGPRPTLDGIESIYARMLESRR